MPSSASVSKYAECPSRVAKLCRGLAAHSCQNVPPPEPASGCSAECIPARVPERKASVRGEVEQTSADRAAADHLGRGIRLAPRPLRDVHRRPDPAATSRRRRRRRRRRAQRPRQLARRRARAAAARPSARAPASAAESRASPSSGGTRRWPSWVACAERRRPGLRARRRASRAARPRRRRARAPRSRRRAAAAADRARRPRPRRRRTGPPRRPG